MRKLFRAFMALVVVVLGTPALALTIMYDGSGETNMPVHLYTEDADAQAMLMQELKDSFDELESGATDDMIYNLHEDIINVAIFQAIREENPQYMPTDDCADEYACYVFHEQVQLEGSNILLRVVGAWVEFDQDIFNLNVFVEVELEDGFTYKTIITTEFKFTDLPGKYVLEFEEIRFGNLPIPSSILTSIMSAVENNVDEVNFNDVAGDIPMGELDLAEMSYTLYKDEIVEKIGEGEEQSTENDLLKEVVSIVFDQELLTFEFKENEFVLSARLSKFKSEDTTDIPAYLYDLHTVDPITNEVGEFDPNALDPESYLQDLFTEFVFNYALVGGGFTIDEEVFNKLIYASSEGFADARTVEEVDLGDGNIEEIELGLKAIWFEIEPDAIYANALIRIASVDSLLTLRADNVAESTTNEELVFEFTEITFGKDEGETASEYLQILDLEVFKQLFAEIGDVEFGYFDEYGTLTISAEGLSELMSDGSNEGVVTVTGISLVQDAIVLDIEATDQNLADVLNDFSDAIQTVVESEELITDLESVLDTTTPGPEQDVYNAVVDLQETLQNEETPTPEQITELFDNFAELDEATQEEFLQTFEDLIDPTVFENFDDLYGQTEEQTTP
jgi:hypothetical protein